MTTPTPLDPLPLPQATMKPARRWLLGWYWLLPAVVAVVLAVILTLSWAQSGETITVHFNEGHGLKPGDSLRCRGIIVGEVRSVDLSPGMQGVDVVVDLRPSATGVAVEGSRFWIVRPQADLTGLSGLDTVVGAKYMAVWPGNGGALKEFTGLEEPPVLETIEPGGLHIVLQAERMGSLRPGVPLTYRQVRIGSVVSARLASDASVVEVQVYVLPQYAELVRENSVFWNVSGFKLRGGLSGLTFTADSAETVLAGGVAMATPDDAGKPARTGRRFVLFEEAVKDSQQWKPSLTLTDPHLPPGVKVPRLVKATLQYRVKGTIYGTNLKEQRGLLLPVGDTLMGPGDLLTVPLDAVEPGELAYEGLAIKLSPQQSSEAIRRIPGKVPFASLSDKRLRKPEEMEDCLIVSDSSVSRFVPVARLTQSDDGWSLHSSLSSELTPANWHGAAVVAVKDGAVIGMLSVKPKTPIVIVPLK